MKASVKNSEDTKWVFLKKGSCSRTMFYILNREFGEPRELEESAADPLAGGIMQQGYQCGLVLGATLAVGAEAYRRCENKDQAVALALKATQHILDSFENRANTIECEDITKTNFSSKLSFAKYFVTGKFVSCYKLADKWAPEAIQTALEGVSLPQNQLAVKTISCASEVAKRLGANEEQAHMVAGLAGGHGLRGNACGALIAAIWMKSYNYQKKENKKSSYPNPYANKTLDDFMAVSDYEFSCKTICGQQFDSIEDHTTFIKNGGCAQLMDTLTA